MHINFGCNFVFYIFKEIRNSLFPSKSSLTAAIHSNQPLVKGNWFLRTISVLDPKTFFSNFFKNRQINQLIKKLEDPTETVNNLLTIDEVLFILSLIQLKDRTQKEEELLNLLIELNYIPSSLPLTVSSTIEPFKAQLLCARSRMEKGLNPTSVSKFIAPLEKMGFSKRILCPKLTKVIPQIPQPPLFVHETTADFEKFAQSIENLSLISHLHKVITALPLGAPFQVEDRLFYKEKADDELIKPMFQLSSLVVQEGGLKRLAKKLKTNHMSAATAQCLFLLDTLLPIKSVGTNLHSSEAKNLQLILEMMRAKKIQHSFINATNVNKFSDANIFFNNYLKVKTIENWCDLFYKILNGEKFKLLNEISFYSQRFFSYPLEDQQDVLQKLRIISAASEKYDKIPNQARLTLREYYIYDTLFQINQISSKLGKNLFFSPLPQVEHGLLLEKINSYNERKNKTAIRVCIQRPRHAHDNLFEGGIKTWLRNQLLKLTGNQGHMNFLIQNERGCSAAGLSSEGPYNKPMSAKKIPLFDEYKIRIKPLIPENSSVEPEEFKSAFVDKLNETLKIKVQGLCLIPLGLLSRAPLVKTNPQKLKFKNTKMHLCSQYVCQAIIHAHIQTCNEFGITRPDSLSFYGLDERERMETLTPNRVQEAFTKSGIFKKTNAVLWQQD